MRHPQPPAQLLAGLRRLLPLPVMAAVCDICGKKPFFGMQVSHSHRRSPKRWNPNVQRVRAVVNGTPKRVNACTSCLKAGRVQRAG